MLGWVHTQASGDVMKKLICLLFGHDWVWRKSYPYERTGTEKDLAHVPGKCLRCEHVPTSLEVSKFARYEGK